MNMLVKNCNLALVSICIFVALIRWGICAPFSLTSEYVHNPFVSHKEKRSADLLDILSNMLLEHSSGVDDTWPDFGSIFNNELSSYENDLPDNDLVNRYLDFNDRNVNRDVMENVKPDSIDYSCSEEENNGIVPFMESGYQYYKRPENKKEEDFIIIKPEVEYPHSIHEYDWGYAENGGTIKSDWNQIPLIPLSETDEIDEKLWKQHSQSTPRVDVNRGIPGDSYKPRETDETQYTKTYGFKKEAKFNIFSCLPGPPEEETKNIDDEYLVLLIKKDHLLDRKRGNQPNAINPPQPETSFTENVSLATSTIHTPTTVQITSTERTAISDETTTVNNVLGSATGTTTLKADDSNKATTQSSYSSTLGSISLPTTVKVDNEGFNFIATAQNSTYQTFASVNLPTTLHVAGSVVGRTTTTQSFTSPKLDRTTLPTTFEGGGKDSRPTVTTQSPSSTTLGSVELTTTLKPGHRDAITTTPYQRTSSPSFGSVGINTTFQAGTEDASSTTTIQSSSSSILGRTILPTTYQEVSEDSSPLVTTQSSISSTFGSMNLLKTILAGDRHTGRKTTTQSYPSTELGRGIILHDTFSFNLTTEPHSSPSTNVSTAIDTNLSPIPFTTSIYTAIDTIATTTQGFKLIITKSPVLSASHISMSTNQVTTQAPEPSYTESSDLFADTTQRSKVPDSTISTFNNPSSSTSYIMNSNVVTNSSHITVSEIPIQSTSPLTTEIYPPLTRPTPYISHTESLPIVGDPKSDNKIDITQVPNELSPSTHTVTTYPPSTNIATNFTEDISNTGVTNLSTIGPMQPTIHPITSYKTSSDSSKYVTSTTERTALVTAHNENSAIQTKELVILANIQLTTNSPFANPETHSQADTLKEETTTFGTVTPDLWTLIE